MSFRDSQAPPVGVYLLRLGRVGDLRQSLSVAADADATDTVVKWGKTDDGLDERIRKHQADYGRIRTVSDKLGGRSVLLAKKPRPPRVYWNEAYQRAEVVSRPAMKLAMRFSSPLGYLETKRDIITLNTFPLIKKRSSPDIRKV
ncbi:hypothetical protein HDU87_000700 [Geranomyces variabilis]|uniref:Uncharacterized protein n=1 Tax=Geranomyces variabilis TaxID=109894 RepID=A0AAD5TQC4_9FUNG|nr:hypothetical protein HDU87_000700 [Geranomyces variabilis]